MSDKDYRNAEKPTGMSRRFFLGASAAFSAAITAKPTVLMPQEEVAEVMTVKSFLPVFLRYKTIRNNAWRLSTGNWTGSYPGGPNYKTISRDIQSIWKDKILNFAQQIRGQKEIDQFLATADKKTLDGITAALEDEDKVAEIIAAVRAEEGELPRAVGGVVNMRIRLLDIGVWQKHKGDLLGIGRDIRKHTINDFAQSPEPIDGFLDGILEEKNGLASLRYLLREAPDIFPAGRLAVFQRVALELEWWGRQITPVKDIFASLEQLLPVNEWQLQVTRLAYRWGLTDHQHIWPPRVPSSPIQFEKRQKFDQGPNVAL